MKRYKEIEKEIFQLLYVCGKLKFFPLKLTLKEKTNNRVSESTTHEGTLVFIFYVFANKPFFFQIKALLVKIWGPSHIWEP